MILVVHNRHDKGSREFVEALPEDYIVVDFYDYESSERKLLEKVKMTISDFPSVVDTDLDVLVLKPASIDDALLVFNQVKINNINKYFLANSDFKVLRHIRQKALNETLSLTEEQYLELEEKRSLAASLIVPV